jgi:hypothetical protein
MTEFRRHLRFHQAQWRAAHGHPIGTQPLLPRDDGKPVRYVGSRLPLGYARETGATFLTPGALDAATERSARIEPHQSIDHQRVWADLLWSPTLAFNLFGDLASDLDLADRAVHRWWPDAPGRVVDVRFMHSPGWLDPAYLSSLRAFDAAFVLDLGDGTHGVIAVDTKYHDRTKPEIPKPTNLARYREVANAAAAFDTRALESVTGRSDLAVMWLEHLLLLSMLQHASAGWSWGRYVVVHPLGNSDFADACVRYRRLLVDESTFSSVALEELVDADALPASTASRFRERYQPQ